MGPLSVDEVPGPPGTGARRPPEVVLAAWLWTGAVVVGLVATVVALLTDRPAVYALVDQAAETDPAVAGTDRELLVTSVLVAGTVVAVVAAGLAVGLVLAMRAGRRWARTALVVLGSAWAVTNVLSLSREDPLSSALAVLGAAFVVAAVITLATKEAAPWFAPRPRRP